MEKVLILVMLVLIVSCGKEISEDPANLKEKSGEDLTSAGHLLDFDGEYGENQDATILFRVMRSKGKTLGLLNPLARKCIVKAPSRPKKVYKKSFRRYEM